MACFGVSLEKHWIRGLGGGLFLHSIKAGRIGAFDM